MTQFVRTYYFISVPENCEGHLWFQEHDNDFGILINFQYLRMFIILFCLLSCRFMYVMTKYDFYLCLSVILDCHLSTSQKSLLMNSSCFFSSISICFYFDIPIYYGKPRYIKWKIKKYTMVDWLSIIFRL